MRNLLQFFVLCTASQIIGGDFAKVCGLLKIYELDYSSGLLFILEKNINLLSTNVLNWAEIITL